MGGYILSILGIVVAGVLIDIVVPSGAISKYIKGIYSIFVVAVLINPVVIFLNKKHDFKVTYQEFYVNDDLLKYIFSLRSKSLESAVEEILYNEGFKNVDIILEFSIENNELNYVSCKINLEKLAINEDKQHINKYEFIRKIVAENTNLTDEEIVIYE